MKELPIKHKQFRTLKYGTNTDASTIVLFARGWFDNNLRDKKVRICSRAPQTESIYGPSVADASLPAI